MPRPLTKRTQLSANSGDNILNTLWSSMGAFKLPSSCAINMWDMYKQAGYSPQAQRERAEDLRTRERYKSASSFHYLSWICCAILAGIADSPDSLKRHLQGRRRVESTFMDIHRKILLKYCDRTLALRTAYDRLIKPPQRPCSLSQLRHALSSPSRSED
jgi:hypothetical protein